MYCIEDYNEYDGKCKRFRAIVENFGLDQYIALDDLDEGSSMEMFSEYSEEREILEILNDFDQVFDQQKSAHYKKVSEDMTPKCSNYYIFESGLMTQISKRLYANPKIDKYKIEQILMKARRHAVEAAVV